MSSLKKDMKDFKVLINNIPSWVVTMFVVSIVCMNLFANKSINLPVDWLALDCGIIFSWMSFLSMDLIVKQFGAKASIKITIFSTLISLIVSILFFLGSIIPGSWGASFDFNDAVTVNNAIDSTVRGNWYIVFGSTVAFLVAGIVNSFLNELIGWIGKKDTYKMFMIRTYVSTTIGQFVDNFVFGMIVSRVLFGWSVTQCLTCAATGALAELLFEAAFTPLGWKICKSWKKNKIGAAYIELQDS